MELSLIVFVQSGLKHFGQLRRCIDRDACLRHVIPLPELIALSKATMSNIRTNIAIALSLKAVFLMTTVLGITGLWPAILADTGATVLVTANAMRLLNWRPR